MEARLINMASGNTIKVIKNPIRWLFAHYRDVSSFEVKAMQHDDSGMLIAYMYIDHPVMLKMTWASYRIMMDRLLNSRAWRNHFSGINVNKRTMHETTTYTI